MPTPVATVWLLSDGKLNSAVDLPAAIPLIQDLAAKSKAGFSLPALLKLIQDLAVDVPVLIADITAVLATPNPPPTSDVPLQ